MPKGWDPWGDQNETEEQEEPQEPIKNWWDRELERQVSLAPREGCKFCQLQQKSSGHELKGWMLTPCVRCNKPRGIHRGNHPHIRDRHKIHAWGGSFDEIYDCSGFVEPDLTLVQSDLDRILSL